MRGCAEGKLNGSAPNPDEGCEEEENEVEVLALGVVLNGLSEKKSLEKKGSSFSSRGIKDKHRSNSTFSICYSALSVLSKLLNPLEPEGVQGKFLDRSLKSSEMSIQPICTSARSWL